MSTFLAAFAQALPSGQRAVPVLDRVGWPGAKLLVVPPTVTLVPCHPDSPS